MKLKPLPIQVAAVIAVILQCQMALGVIEERGEFEHLAVLVHLCRFEQSTYLGKAVPVL
jgi:hypothetical protein